MEQDIVTLASEVFCDEGRPLVLLHGFSQNRHVWRSIAEALSLCSLRPISIDLRGHGDSGWSCERHYQLDDYARDLPAALDALGLTRVILVAHSLGGHAATLFAALHPERVEALVLVDTGPSLSIAALTQIASDTEHALDSFESVENYHRWLGAQLPLADPKALAAFAPHCIVRRLDGRFEVKLDPGVLLPSPERDDWQAMERQLEDALRKIDCPTLLVRGGLSAVLPEPVARHICETLLSNGRLHTLERVGHAVMLEDGPALCRAIENFAEAFDPDYDATSSTSAIH